MVSQDAVAEPATALTQLQPAEDGASQEEIGGLTSRGKGLLGAFGGAYYFEGIGKAVAGGLWSKDNPDGYTVLAVAENRQSIDLVQERLARIPAVPREAFFYDSFQGILRFRKALANLLMQTFMQGLEIDAEHIAVQSGCGAVLSCMFNSLGERGDSVLIPAPYYPGFDFDTKASAGLVSVPVHCCVDKPLDSDMVPAIADAADAAEADGHPPRALLLCHPNNPLGIIYTEQQLQSMLEWCLQRGVHMISDEVYANSIFGADAKFVSMAALAQRHVEAHPEDAARVANLVHVVFGVSKDFCASGFRVGAVYTHNAGFLKAASIGGYFQGVSNIVQHALSELFEDSEWLAGYVAENTKRLGAAYDAISGALTKAEIPYVAAESTMMLWMDLRMYLSEATWEAERALWHRLADEQHVILTPGECCHASEPGFFRACYAWGDDIAALPVTVQRIHSCLAK